MKGELGNVFDTRTMVEPCVDSEAGGMPVSAIMLAERHAMHVDVYAGHGLRIPKGIRNRWERG